MKLRFLALAMLLFCTTALAQQDDAIVVTALRDPVQKSYRKMIEGMEQFDARRAELAPAAALRFKLIPRKPDTKMEDVRLEVASDSKQVRLEVGPDRTFTLTPDPVALKENAKVMPDRKAGTMTWRADVRTPGLPPHVRRLGDLRLECEVGMKSGLISNYPSGFFGWLEELLGRGVDYCHRPDPRYLFFADRPVWRVTLVDGARREDVPLKRLYAGAAQPEWRKGLEYCDCEALVERTYFVPLSDASWSNDTRVEIEYVDGGEVADTTKEIVRSVLGETMVFHFAAGHEMWAYGDLVLLFDAAGALRKARTQ